MKKKKMQLGKYISTAVLSVFFFTLVWVLNTIADNSEKFGKWLAFGGGIISLIAFTSITLSVLVFSTKQFISAFKFKEEKGLWKVLNFIFKIGMFIFAVLIVIFWLVWFIYMLKDGFGNKKIMGVNIWEGTSKIDQFASISMFHISNYFEDVYKILGFSTAPFGLYVTSFVFLLIWSAAGLAYEIIKKLLGGNRAAKEKNS